jgi:Arc/MetJ family transcription regulator
MSAERDVGNGFARRHGAGRDGAPERVPDIVPDIHLPRRTVYIVPMTKRLVDIDDEALDAARKALDTRTIKDTVNAALRGAASLAARQRHLARFAGDGLPDLRDPDIMAQAWR